MRASRLVSLLLLLQTRGRMTAQELADELAVSVRTVYRDAEALHAAGVPIYGDAGHSGGYQLVDGYRTRLTGLTHAEAEALFLAGLPGPAAELGLGSVVAAANLKLMAALPEDLRDRAGRISTRFHLDTPGWYHDSDDTPYLAVAADAVWNERVMRVLYRRWKAPQEVHRVLKPYGLVLKGGRWYLVADGGERIATYRVSQILAVQPLDEKFERPAEFDLAAHWKSYLDDFDAHRYQAEATIRLSPNGLHRLSDELPQTVPATSPDPDGWTRAVMPIESTRHAARELLRLGDDVEVVAPQELRDVVKETITALHVRYGGSSP